jgi:argininosuccinate lyase
MAMLTVGKGLPLAYNKDLQEDKEGLFDTFDTVDLVLQVLPPMLRTAEFRVERLGEAAAGGFSLATDLADHLVRQGVPFREAHEIVGRVVAYCIAQSKDFPNLTAEEWSTFSPILAESRPPLTPRDAVEAREMLGGTGPRHVADARAAAGEELVAWREWLQQRRADAEAVARRIGIAR